MKENLLSLLLALVMVLTLVACGAPTSNNTPSPSPAAPTDQVSSQPTEQPSAEPSEEPSEEPSAEPSEEPSEEPSAEPSMEPSAQPSTAPSEQPSAQPSTAPSEQPSAQPSSAPTHSHSYGAWKSNGNGTHTKTCTGTVGACDAKSVTEKCTIEFGTCSKCRYAAPSTGKIKTLLPYDEWQPENMTNILAMDSVLKEKYSGGNTGVKAYPKGISTADPVLEGSIEFRLDSDDGYSPDGLVKVVEDGYFILYGFATEVTASFAEDFAYILNTYLKELTNDEVREFIVAAQLDNGERYNENWQRREAAPAWDASVVEEWDNWWAENMAPVCYQVGDVLVHFANESYIEVFAADIFETKGMETPPILSASEFPWYDTANKP